METTDVQIKTQSCLMAYKDRAKLIPIDGPYSALATEVRRLLGWYPEFGRPYLTTRMASRKTGVSASTIGSMARGDRPSATILRNFAFGLDVAPVPLLYVAGYLADREISATEINNLWTPALKNIATTSGCSEKEAWESIYDTKHPARSMYDILGATGDGIGVIELLVGPNPITLDDLVEDTDPPYEPAVLPDLIREPLFEALAAAWSGGLSEETKRRFVEEATREAQLREQGIRKPKEPIGPDYNEDE